MADIVPNKYLRWALYAVLPLGLVLLSYELLTTCFHRNTGSPITVENEASGEKECRIVCMGCGASALYDPFDFKRIGPWEKPRPVNQKQEIRPHAYRMAGSH